MRMKGVKYIINDYNHFIDLKCGMDFHGAIISESYNIDESKGIIDDYVSIIDELYDAVSHTKPIPFNDSRFYLSYAMHDYKMKQDCFIDSLTLVVGTRSELNSNFRGEEAEILSRNYRMRNVRINIFIENPDIKSKIGKEEFYDRMSHELQHAYRFYCILLSDNGNYQDEEHRKMIRSKNANDMMDNSENETPQNIISKLYYFSDKNEISSETNRLYEYIRSHEDINYDNYHLKQDELPLYIPIQNLKMGIEKIDDNKGNESFVNIYGTIYKSIIEDDKSTPRKALMKLRTRLIYAYVFSKRNFNRILMKAFKDFNRFTEFNERKTLRTLITWNEVEGRDDFNQLKEILER